MTERRKIIIDTDPGVDDAMAIFLALCSPELELLGLTTVFGNVHTPLATENALRLLEIAGRPDIPVAQGALRPLVRPYKGPVPFIHGEDGQGNVFLEPPQTRALEQAAAQFLVEQIMAHPGQVTLVAIAPLTNLALALALEPRIAGSVREVVLMGGAAFVPGNATQAAEANIMNDPEAADLVLGAPWPVTMVGLDVTHQVLMTDAQLGQFAAMPSAMAQHIRRIVPLYRDFNHQSFSGLEGIYIHDSSAVVCAMHPELFETAPYKVRVEVDGALGVGKTWAVSSGHAYHASRPGWPERPEVRVCVGVDSEKVLELSLERMQG